VRTTAVEALRYSRFVMLMKRLLSLGAFLIIAAVLAFFFVQRMPRQLQMSYERLGRIENDLTMVKPRLTGADAKGNPFVITADSAVQDAVNPKKASLKNLEADLTLDKQNWINARARAGMVDMAAGQLELSGGIDVFTANGYELHSNSASANLKQSTIHGHEPVTGQGPQGTLRADTFHADRSTNILTLSGHVQMTLTGTKK
jgi:lipopolysaccharide export system protein LptC